MKRICVLILSLVVCVSSVAQSSGGSSSTTRRFGLSRAQTGITPLGGYFALPKFATGSIPAAAAGNEGAIVYDDTTNTIKVSNGTSWDNYGLALAGPYLPFAGGTMTGTLTSQQITPTGDKDYSLGESAHRYRNIYVQSIGSGTDPLAFSVNGHVASFATTGKLTVNEGGIQSGASGYDGQFVLYSEQGLTDYTATLNPNAAMTSNGAFYLPADEPAATYLLNMTSGGVMGYDTTDYEEETHASEHQSGGADAIKIDDLAAADDNTDLNASTSAHGLLPKLDNNASNYLNGQGAWSAPASVAGADTQIQYNDSGALGADAGLTTNKAGALTATGTVTATQFSANSSDSTGVTDLLINPGVKTSGNLIAAQVNGATKFRVNFAGGVSAADIFGNAIYSSYFSKGSNNTANYQHSGWSVAGNVAKIGSGTHTNSSGILNVCTIQPTYNQTGTAGATDLLINRTQTAVGSGAQRLIDAQVGGVSKFSVDNTGTVTAGRYAQTTGTIADDDTTPDVSGGTVFYTVANTTGAAITDLDSPTVGVTYTIIIGSATNITNIADGGNFKLAGAWAPDSVDDSLVVFCKADDYYVELSRSNN